MAGVRPQDGRTPAVRPMTLTELCLVVDLVPVPWPKSWDLERGVAFAGTRDAPTSSENRRILDDAGVVAVRLQEKSYTPAIRSRPRNYPDDVQSHDA